MAPETVSDVVDDAIGAGESSTNFEAVPLEVLERNLTSHAAHLAAAEAQWLVWLGEYCVREGWGSWGCSGPVQWLSWQCGMSPSTAREKVRVASALRELPVITRFHLEGRLSYSKVRALTRVATVATDRELAQLAVAATGAQLDVIVRSFKKARDADRAAATAWGQRSWRGRVDGEESMVFTFRVPAHHGDSVQVAVRGEVNKLIDDTLARLPQLSRSEVIESRGGWAAMCSDAALALLNGTARTNEVPVPEVDLIIDDDHGVEVVVDGRAVAPVVGYRLCCDPRIAALVEQSRGTVLGSGRRTRLVSRKLRRALQRRDKGQCQFPGCGTGRHLHAHHIVHWANGGPTELHNLILVCTFHHHVVHEGSWNIDSNSHDFIKPDGTVVDKTPTERSRGSASATTQFVSFGRPAPLAEAENTAFDLGLVLESLAWDPTDSGLEYGPPIPTSLARQRTLEAHWARTAR